MSYHSFKNESEINYCALVQKAADKGIEFQGREVYLPK